MNRTQIIVMALLGLAGVVAASARAEVPQEDLDKIRLAAPDNAPAEPKKPRKLLIFSRDDGAYMHESIPWGAQALRILGDKSGAYTPVLSDNPAMFDRQALSEFDAVVFNNNCGNPVADRIREKNVLEFVRSGRGVVAIHCANHLWPEFIDMIGGRSISHPWNAGSTVCVKLDDPDHPLVRCFCRSSFLHTDEIFEFKDYSRDKVRVLLSLDITRTDMNRPAIVRTDGDFPLSWVRSYGKGRVFYCALGHQKDVYWRPPILKHFLAGIQFALGDLDADTTPSAKITQTREEMDP